MPIVSLPHYNIMKITPYFLLTLFVITWCSVSPTPYCHQRPLYSHFPLTINETVIADLGYAFTGYNLEYKVEEGADFVSVKPKMEQLSFKNYNFTEILSLKVAHQGNRWGDSMFVLSNDHGQITLHYGHFKNHTESPELEAAVVLYREDAYCFDAVLYPDQGYAIVDCIELIDEEWTNKFVYINLSTKERVAEIINEKYAYFDRDTRRRLFRYHDPHNTLEYMVRAYMSHDNNSYIELFHSTDLHQIEILRVFDRSTLGLKKFSIVDIQVYLGDIFVLDYFTGLYRLDILRGQDLVSIGHYPAQHYTKFSLYSDDLDQQLLLVLANNHAIYQINLDRFSEPYLITKYSIPSNSWVHKIVVDSKFLIVQSSANVSSDDGYILSNYTYVFTKGSRTYMNAYKVIEHASWNVLFDYDRIERRLMFAAEENVTNYKLNEPNAIIFQNNSGALGTNKTLSISAISTDPHSDKIVVCNSTSEVAFVASDDKSIYPTDLPLPQVYYANYPGEIRINLRNYAIGPNITYNITDNSNTTFPPVFWLDQQNDTIVRFDKNPITPNNLQFFWAQVFPHRGNNTIFYFYQENNNNFHVSMCEHYYNDIIIDCRHLMTQSFRYKINSFTSVPFMMAGAFHLYYAITLQGSNAVYLHDNGHDRIGTIQFPDGYDGIIGDIEASNGFLYVCLPYIKTINVYKMSKCENHHCPIEFQIDAHAMAALGVKYFNPRDLVTSQFHPEVVFINNLGSLIIIDIDNHENLILLAEVTDSPAVHVSGFEIAVHEQYLVIVASPNIIEEYHMGSLYSSKKLTYLKNLELYQYKLDSDFDLEFSDHTNLFYLQATDTKTNLTTVLVYKIGSFLVNSLYDVINLEGRYRHNNLLIEICGFGVDYVNLVSDVGFSVYRQFPVPTLIIEDTFEDFKLDVAYYNNENNKSLATLNFSVTNYPKEFNTTQLFQDDVRDNLRVSNEGQYTWDPRKWFDGHVIGYNTTTNDSKVRLIDQIYEKGEIDVKGTDFIDSFTGGYAIAEDVVKFYMNGSVNKIILLPDQQQGEICLRIDSRYDDLFSVVGCQHYTGGVNIYFNSEASLKGFSWGPYITQAHFLKNLQLVHYMLVVTDTDEPGIFMQRGGTIFLYALNLDPVTDDQMDLIEEIDSNDFFGAHGWDQEDAILGNSHLVYDSQDDAYRLYVTEMYNGLFVIEFNHTFGHNQIQVLATNYIDLNEILESNNFHMPVDAHFLAVTFVSVEHNPYLEVESVLVTTNKYHNFEFQIIYDENARVQACHLHRVYYRYGWYEAANIVKAEQDYFAIPYILPEIYSHMNPNYSRQYIVVYDMAEYEKDHAKGYSERYMLGGFQINNTNVGGFGFNVTYDPLHNGTRTGFVAIDVRAAKMHENSLSRNLTVEADEGYGTGTMEVVAFNDFHSEKFNIFYHAHSKGGLQVWEIVLIAVSCSVFALLCGYLFYLCWKKRQSKPTDESRISLMESEVGAALLRHGEAGSERGSLPETHFRSTQNFETQTDFYVPPKLVQEVPTAKPQQNPKKEAVKEPVEETREVAKEEVERENEQIERQERPPVQTEEVRLPEDEEEDAPAEPQAQVPAEVPAQVPAQPPAESPAEILPSTIDNLVPPPAEDENQ